MVRGPVVELVGVMRGEAERSGRRSGRVRRYMVGWWLEA